MTANPMKAIAARHILEKHNVVLPERVSRVAPRLDNRRAQEIMNSLKGRAVYRSKIGWPKELWAYSVWPREGGR